MGFCVHYIEFPRSLPIQPLLWTAFGLAAARSCLYGLRTEMISHLRDLVAGTRRSVETDRVSREDERRLSSWCWTAFQLSFRFF